MDEQKTLTRHSVQVAVQAVNNDEAGIALLDSIPYFRGKLSGRQFGDVHLDQFELPRSEVRLEIHTEAARPKKKRVLALLKLVTDGMLTPIQRCHQVLRAQSSFPASCWSDDERTCPAIEATPKQLIELGTPARRRANMLQTDRLGRC